MAVLLPRHCLAYVRCSITPMSILQLWDRASTPGCSSHYHGAPVCRMLWSFSRDGGVPLYRVWASLNPRTQTPNNAVWAMTALAFLLGLPMIWSNVAFQAIGSISSIALWLSCAQLGAHPSLLWPLQSMQAPARS